MISRRAFVLGLLWTVLVVAGVIGVVEWFELDGSASGIVGIVGGLLIVEFPSVAMWREW